MKIYKVGGAVRDEIMGIEPQDIDYVVVGSTPEEMYSLGYHQVSQTFPVFLKDGEEYALARTERKSGNGYTGFTTNHTPYVTLEDDLKRRDLTINAIAQDLETGEIFDFFGGRDDIKNGILRHVSSAFSDDPVRILRVARFSARYGFTVDPSTMDMMKAMVDFGEVKHLISERVWKEVSRAMMEPNPQNFFRILKDVDAMHDIFDLASIAFSDLTQRMMLFNVSNATEIERWMGTFMDVGRDIADNFIEKQSIPTEISEAISFGVTANRIDFSDPIELFNLCKVYRLWQDTSLLETYLKVSQLWMLRLEDTDAILNAINESSKVNFEYLSEKEKNQLVGAGIGRRLDEIRIDIMSKSL